MPVVATPSPPIPSFSTGEIVTQSRLNALGEHADLLYRWSAGGYRIARPMCGMHATSGALGDLVFAPLTFQAEDYDTDGMFTPGTAYAWIRTPGVYLLQLQATLQAQASGVPAGRYFGTIITINGSIRETDAVAYDKQTAPASQTATSHCSALVPLDAGSIVYFWAEQNTGTGTGSVSLEVTDGGCRASAEWVGPLAAEIGQSQ